VPGALLECTAVTLLGLMTALALGWGWQGGIVFGLSLSVASTVVLTRVLSDRGEMQTPAGRIAVGWLVVEDVLTVLMLVLLPQFAGEATGTTGPLLKEVGWSLLKLATLVALTLVGGGKLIPWVLDRVAATRSRELFTLTILVIALGIAVGSARGFGVSMALGAFLAGMVVGQSEFGLRAAIEAIPLRDAFAVLFFVSAGMLFNPREVLAHWPPALAAVLLVLVAKPLLAMGVVRGLGQSRATAVAMGLSLAQIGEFSFILAGLGRSLNLLSGPALQAVVCASLVSMTLNPLLVNLAPRLLALWHRCRGPERHNAATADSSTLAESPQADGQGLAVVVGYGPVGQAVCQLLTENGIRPTVVERNLDTVRRLKSSGWSAIYGTAEHRDTLVAAGVDQAKALVLTADASEVTHEVVRLAAELNPRLRVLVRTRYLSEQPNLPVVARLRVICDEREAALGLLEQILRELGATPEQIDRQRDRFHRDLGGTRPGSGPGAEGAGSVETQSLAEFVAVALRDSNETPPGERLDAAEQSAAGLHPTAAPTAGPGESAAGPPIP
ncbi:MAG: cation:proton antiporter, partial [Planctomycetaceae bacterium]